MTGVRGQVGSAVLRALLDAGHPVRAASRRPGDAAPVDGAQTVRFDQAGPQTLPEALAGVRKAFLHAAPEGIEDFTEAARKAGVEHVVLLSALSAEPGHDESAIALTQHLPAPFADAVISCQAEQDGKPQPTHEDVPAVLGRPATGFATWAADHAEGFR